MLVNGKASIVLSGLKLGLHPITAVYSGDGNFLASTGTFNQNVGFIFIDTVSGNTLIVTVPANGVSGQGSYTWISNGVTIVSNVSALIEFNTLTVRIRTNAPSLNALFDLSTSNHLGEAILIDPNNRNKSYIINISTFVLTP